MEHQSHDKRKKKKRFCLEDGCRLDGPVKGYCRTHYLAHWREMRDQKKTRAEKKLDDFVNRLAERYPKDYLKKIKEGLEDDEKFAQTIQELDLDPDKEAHETEREFIERLERKVKVD